MKKDYLKLFPDAENNKPSVQAVASSNLLENHKEENSERDTIKVENIPNVQPDVFPLERTKPEIIDIEENKTDEKPEIFDVDEILIPEIDEICSQTDREEDTAF